MKRRPADTLLSGKRYASSRSDSIPRKALTANGTAGQNRNTPHSLGKSPSMLLWSLVDLLFSNAWLKQKIALNLRRRGPR